MLPPLNLLALDTTAFEADLGTWQGVQAAGSGFQTTLSGLRQGALPAPAALSQLVAAGSADAPVLPVLAAPGEGLPPAGKRLPLGEAEAGLGLPANPETPGILAGVQETLGAVVPRDPPGTTDLPASLPAPPPSTATDVDVPEHAPAATGWGAGSAAALESAVRIGPATVPGQLRYPPPAATAGLSPGIVAGDAAEAEMSPPPRETPATIREPGLLQQVVQQAMQPVRAKAGVPAVDVLPQADLADARPVPSSPSPLPFVTTSATAALSSSSQWVASQVHTPPGQPGWGEALGERVLWMTGNGLKNAELRLNPAELGPVRVQISVDDGNATVSFSAQHPLTRDAIEQALPRLREMLADQGLSLQNADVSEGSGGNHSGPGRQDVHDFSPGVASPPLQADGPALPAMRHAVGLVDLFA